MHFSTKQLIMGILRAYLYADRARGLLTSFLQMIAFYFAGLTDLNVKKFNNYLNGMRLLRAKW